MLRDFAAGFSSALTGPKLSPQILAKEIGTSPDGGNVFNLQVGGSGLTQGDKQLINSVGKSPNLKRVIDIIASSLTSVPFFLIKKNSVGKKSKSWPLWMRTCGDFEYRNKTALQEGEIITDHPFVEFLYRGSPLLNGPTSLKLSWEYKLIKGEFFWRMLYNGSRLPQWYQVIPPQWVQAVPSRGTESFKIKMSGDNDPTMIPEEEVLWAKDAGLAQPYGRGEGMGDALTDEIDTDEYAARLMRYTLANRGFADMLIGIKGPSTAQAEMVEAKYNQRHRGFYNAGRALVIDTDKLEVKPITHSLSELRLLELREFERTMIAETFGVPPELIGKTSASNRATVREAEAIFAKHVLTPRLVSMQQDLQLNILPAFDPKGQYLVGFHSPVPADRDYQLEVMIAQPSAFTLNEWREQAGKQAESWGDERASVTPAKPTGESEAAKVARPFVRKDLTSTEIQALLSRIDSTELVAKLGPGWRSQMEQIVLDQWSQIGFGEGSLTLVNPLISDHLESFGGQFIDRGGIDTTTRELVGKTLSEGVARGESMQELAKRLRTQIGFLQGEGYRSTLIARTEVVRSSNVARQMSWETSGMELQKEYISALSSTTRDSHAALHGKVVPLKGSWKFNPALEPFQSGTTSSPGNSGVAAHDCSCLCSMVAFDPEHDREVNVYGSEVHEALFKAFDKATRSWEAEMIGIMSPFYAKMEDELVRALLAAGA